ncbi:MAG: thermostable hemolysin delta-VPH [Christensenellales bacterium]|jgi:hypothetical protein
MTYYNYHAKVKEKLLSGQLKTFKIVDEYNTIKPAMLLEFNDGKIYPIREHMWEHYFDIINKL